MNEERIVRSRRHFENAGSLACAMVLGWLLWNMSLRSDQEVTTGDYLTLLVYTSLALSSYLGAFLVSRRANPTSAKEVNLNWVYASVIGTSASFIAESVHVWLRYRPSNLFGFIAFSFILLCIFIALMLLVMASVIGAGAIL